MTFSSRGHLSALVFSPLTTRATFTKCQSCTLPFGQLRLHFTTRANSMKRADGKRVCRRSRESHAWSGRRTAAAHRWSLRGGSIGWRSSIATHSPSAASGVASALRASKSRQKPLICVQWISMAVAPGERTTAGLGCSPGCGPTVRVADPEVADPAHPQRGMPRVRHRRGVFFRPGKLVKWFR